MELKLADTLGQWITSSMSTFIDNTHTHKDTWTHGDTNELHVLYMYI